MLINNFVDLLPYKFVSNFQDHEEDVSVLSAELALHGHQMPEDDSVLHVNCQALA